MCNRNNSFSRANEKSIHTTKLYNMEIGLWVLISFGLKKTPKILETSYNFANFFPFFPASSLFYPFYPFSFSKSWEIEHSTQRLLIIAGSTPTPLNSPLARRQIVFQDLYSREPNLLQTLSSGVHTSYSRICFYYSLCPSVRRPVGPSLRPNA